MAANTVGYGTHTQPSDKAAHPDDTDESSRDEGSNPDVSGVIDQVHHHHLQAEIKEKESGTKHPQRPVAGGHF